MEQEQEQQPLSLSLSFSLSVVSAASAPSSSGEHSSPADAVIFFGLSLALGIACRHLLRGTRVPYTVALLIIGIALGSIGPTLLFFILLFVVDVVVIVCFLEWTTLILDFFAWVWCDEEGKRQIF